VTSLIILHVLNLKISHMTFLARSNVNHVGSKVPQKVVWQYLECLILYQLDFLHDNYLIVSKILNPSIKK